MRQTHKILAHLIAAAVVIQAVVIAWSTFTVINMIESGVTVTGPPASALIHSMLGMYVIPLLAVALLVVAFLSHAGIRWAAWLLLAVVVQIAVALAAFSTPALGILHGLVAFGILALAEVGAWSVAHAPAHVASSARMKPAV